MASIDTWKVSPTSGAPDPGRDEAGDEAGDDVAVGASHSGIEVWHPAVADTAPSAASSAANRRRTVPIRESKR